MPTPKFVIAVGDDVYGCGILNNSYAVIEAQMIFLWIQDSMKSPSSREILKGLLALPNKIEKQQKIRFLELFEQLNYIFYNTQFAKP